MAENELSPAAKRQLVRFCLYGFLKNQQYFDPFLILAFREKGLSFTAIGVLLAFRSVCVNILEIPSGAAADVWGRRRSMMVSMASYAASFVVFALADSYLWLFPAMLAFAVGEAFRTGTHKAMIFDWVDHEGMRGEKTRIYGLTRSWSKRGSALNVIIAAAVVIATSSYQWVFWISVIPYALNVVNFTFYPRYLDGTSGRSRSPGEILATLRSGLVLCGRRPVLRNLIAENVSFEGMHTVAQTYLQPLLKTAALGLPVLVAAPDQTRTAVLVALVYAGFNLLGGSASRHSHRAVARAGNETRLLGWIWRASLIAYVAAGTGMLTGLSPLPILAFIVLAVLLNVWKPVFVSRFHDSADKETAATTLSVANQSKTLAVALLAPVIGMAVDGAAQTGDGLFALWPVAACGALASALGLILHGTTRGSGPKQEPERAAPPRSH